MSVRTLRLLMVIVALCAPLAAPGGELGGEELFIACEGCHSIKSGAEHRVGPNLHGLNGRKAAAEEGFAYSPALQAADITWDEATLTAWIMQAEGMVPGTWMLYHNHLEADEVQRLVGYILAQE